MKPEVFYLRGRAEEDTDLVRSIKERGLGVPVMRSIDEIRDRLKERTPIAILVDACASDTELSERIVEVTYATEIHHIPTILIAKRVQERAGHLKAQLPELILLEFPYRIDSVLDLLFIAQGSASSLPAVEQVPSARLDPKELGTSFGGRALVQAGTKEAFDDSRLMPEHPHKEKVMELVAEIDARSPWLGAHSRRTTFMASALFQKQNIKPQGDALLRAAAMVLNQGVLSLPDSLLNYDLLQTQGKLDPRIFADAFRQTAERVRKEMGDEKVATLIQSVADILSNETSKVPAEYRRLAEGLLLSELVDRACWKRGVWEPQGVHRALRMMRELPYFSNPEVLMGMGRILGEAIFSEEGKPGLYISARTQEEERALKHQVQEERQAAEKQFKGKEKKKLRIFELQAGMLLAEPLLAEDGSLLLPAGTELDADIIFRILQLSAIRPLLRTIHVVQKGPA